MAGNTIVVEGLTELNRAFARIGPEYVTAMKISQAEIAEPVRHDAAELAGTEIRKNTARWSEMRTGLTSKYVYVAPKAKRRKGPKRPNMFGLLMDRALQPALDKNADLIVEKYGQVFEEIAHKNGF